MRKIWLLIALVGLVFSLTMLWHQPRVAPAPVVSNNQLLQQYGWMLNDSFGLTPEEIGQVMQGMIAHAQKYPAPLSLQEHAKVLQTFLQSKTTAQSQAKLLALKASNVAFLKALENKGYHAVEGIYVKILAVGDAQRIQTGMEALTDYTATLLDGTFIEKTPRPFAMPYDRTVPGIATVLRQVGVGGTVDAYIPPELGFGVAGSDKVPPESVVHFVATIRALQSVAPESPLLVMPPSSE